VPSPARALAAIAVAATVVAGAAPAGARVSEKRTKVSVKDACTMLQTPKLAAFGRPVKVAEEGFFGKYGCDGDFGTDINTPPGGRVLAVTIFPSILLNQSTSHAAVEDQHALDVLSQHELEDLSGVGRSAYLDLTQPTINVDAGKKFAFRLVLTRAGATSLSAADRKHLIALAKDIVARGPK